MFGAIAKNYLAEREGIDRKNVIVVSGMPCTAKKSELARPELETDGIRDVDYALTTREVGELFQRADIKFASLEEEPYDNPMGTGSGAGMIFGVTGGVMEAALRTAADWMTGQDNQISYQNIRGKDGIRSAEIQIGDRVVKVAIVHGLKNAGKIMQEIRENRSDYDFIEVMTCPGGCVNGGGQMQQTSDVRMGTDLATERGNVLYGLDDSTKIRKSHKNPQIQQIYQEYLGEAGSELAHKLLHLSLSPDSHFCK